MRWLWGSEFLFSTILGMSTARRFFLRDEGLEEPDNFSPDRGVLAQEIVVDLESAFEQFREIAADFVRKHWVTWQVAVVPGRGGERRTS